MSRLALAGQKYLVVEDEYLAASDLLMALEDEGARVYGPVSDVARAVEVLSDPSFQLDAAILDINLGGEMVFPAAELLIKQKTPFVFLSGFDRIALPETFRDVPWLSKPYESSALITLLQSVRSSC